MTTTGEAAEPESSQEGSEQDPIVLVLRFRDLVVSTAGHTVAEHNKIIAKHGYVWWGWWRKQNEQIPVALWQSINAQSEESSTTVLLVDSGQRKLFRATLAEVSYSLDESEAPENGAKTPGYYQDSQQQGHFASWFKIDSEISEIDSGEIQDYVYRQLPHDDVVVASERQLLGRRIPNLRHLLSFGNVTYWVATPAPDGSYDASPVFAVLPSAVDPHYPMRTENSLVLHLTDLHLGSHHAWAVRPTDLTETSLPAAIASSLGEKRPSIVLVTGDLTWSGSETEFEDATECLDDIRSRLGLKKTDFIIIPGNHDAGWIRKDEAASWDGQYRLENAGGLANYRRFFSRWYQTDPDDHLSIGRRAFMVGGDSVDFLGFNSAALQQVEGVFAGVGHVPRAVFQNSAANMGWDQKERATHVRVMMLHHHLLPVTGEEALDKSGTGFGITSNAAELLRLAADNGVDLVVHGHQHQPFAGTWSEVPMSGTAGSSRAVNVLGGGSCGVVDPDLGPIRQRTFNLLEFKRGAIHAHLYGTHETQREFTRLKSMVSSHGESWRET